MNQCELIKLTENTTLNSINKLSSKNYAPAKSQGRIYI